ncbi:hypothetical protein RIF29_20523 [Crotalaria pallida]|uniref:Uncharacterized protein n=1 Tax=Crotalaria pallida TaxID=3830 RepID=A0AAN9F352_CROPI
MCSQVRDEFSRLLYAMLEHFKLECCCCTMCFYCFLVLHHVLYSNYCRPLFMWGGFWKIRKRKEFGRLEKIKEKLFVPGNGNGGAANRIRAGAAGTIVTYRAMATPVRACPTTTVRAFPTAVLRVSLFGCASFTQSTACMTTLVPMVQEGGLDSVSWRRDDGMAGREWVSRWVVNCG